MLKYSKLSMLLTLMVFNIGVSQLFSSNTIENETIKNINIVNQTIKEENSNPFYSIFISGSNYYNYMGSVNVGFKVKFNNKISFETAYGSASSGESIYIGTNLYFSSNSDFAISYLLSYFSSQNFLINRPLYRTTYNGEYYNHLLISYIPMTIHKINFNLRAGPYFEINRIFHSGSLYFDFGLSYNFN